MSFYKFGIPQINNKKGNIENVSYSLRRLTYFVGCTQTPSWGASEYKTQQITFSQNLIKNKGNVSIFIDRHQSSKIFPLFIYLMKNTKISCAGTFPFNCVHSLSLFLIRRGPYYNKRDASFLRLYLVKNIVIYPLVY